MSDLQGDVQKDVGMKCADEPCRGMEVALANPPREGMGLQYQLVINMKTGAESYVPVYYMRRNQKKGDMVFKVLFCPFCGERLDHAKREVGG